MEKGQPVLPGAESSAKDRRSPLYFVAVHPEYRYYLIQEKARSFLLKESCASLPLIDLTNNTGCSAK